MSALQDEQSVILTIEITHEPQINGLNIYRNILTPELTEHLEVQYKSKNVVERYTACLKNGNGATIGYLKDEKSGRFPKTIFYYLQSHPEAKCTSSVTGKRFNLGDGEGLQVSCILHTTEPRNFITILKKQFDLWKEKY